MTNDKLKSNIMKTSNTQIFNFSNPQIVFILLLSVLASCSPQRRLDRLVAHHPELRIADTLLIRDTIITLPVVADTALSIMRLTDTVTISRDRLEIKLVRINDTILVKGTCKADTIIQVLHVPVEKIRLVKSEGKVLSKVLWIVVGLGVIAVLWKVVIRDA